MNDFGRNFRKLRLTSGHTQESLAEALHLSTSVINRIEHNKRKIDIDLVYKMSTVLDMDVSTIIAELLTKELW